MEIDLQLQNAKSFSHEFIKKMKFYQKKWKCTKKNEILPKNEIIPNERKFYKKNEILPKNEISHFLSKVEILVKNQKFG